VSRLDEIAALASRTTRWTLCLAGLAAAGCSFGQADTGIGPVSNSCVFDTDCPSKHCQAGLCVTRTTATTLSVTLEVTPKRMPDGSQPFPIIADPFALKGGTTRFDLHLPIAVPVRIFNSSKQVERIDAQVSFRPRLDSRFVAKTTLINAVGSGSKTVPTDISVLLLSGINYDVVIRPTDPKLPPHSEQFQVNDDAPLEIDYGTIAWQERKFTVSNAPGTLTLRAIAKSTGQPISNSMSVGPTGPTDVTLLFEPGDMPYQLELSATDQPQKASVEAASCRDVMSPLPTLTVDAANLTASKQDPKTLVIDLPTLPRPLVYSGGVTPCPGQMRAGILPMDLKRTALNYGSSTNVVSASYETSTTATWDDESQQFQFCTQLLPGDYVVVVTPPLSGSCERFAERRLLSTPSDGDEITDAVLALRSSATLIGKVVTADSNPIANASIDLVALGTAGVTLAENDPTVPLYNRSRQGITGADGSFKIPADIGSYDVIIKPPSPSNFAWSVIYNVTVGSRTQEFATIVTLEAPVAVTGTLLYQGGVKSDQRTLGSAEVHAYTVINDNEPNARSIEIGRSQADENGSVMLLLSPNLRQTW
jgi:hypothetical protein